MVKVHSEKHIPSLDGVRGLAVLIVVAYHLGGGAQSSNAAVRIVGEINKAGWTGVTLFFVLSGFLITGILWDTKGTPHKFKNFYARRTLRIFPLYYATLLAVLLAAVVAGTGRECLSSISVFAVYLQNVPLFSYQANHIGSPLSLYHFWSLAVEEQFYLVWPFLIYRSKSLKSAKSLCVAVFVTSFAFRVIVGSADFGQFILSRAGELAAGAFLAISYRDGTWPTLQRRARAVFLASLAAFALLFPFAPFQGCILAGTIMWAAFLVLALTDDLVKSAMSTGWLRWLGTISYGVYVFHVLLFHQYEKLAARILPHAGFAKLVMLRGVFDFVGTLLLASASFHLFEKQILKQRKKFRPVIQTTPHPVS